MRRPGARSRQALLAALAILVAAGYLALPPNHGAVRFLWDRIRMFPGEWRLLRDYPQPSDRLRIHYGLNYTGPIFLRENVAETDLLQLPPRSYLARFAPPGQDRWAEPRFIYYVAGAVPTTTWRGGMDPAATHALVVDTVGSTPSLRIRELADEATRAEIAELYDAKAER